MTQPVRASRTTTTLLHLDWTAMSTETAKGGSEITSYNVQWDAGTSGSAWTHLQGHGTASLLTEIEITSGVAGGEDYQVRVRAENVYGFGVWSAATTIYASSVPDQVTQSTLSSVVTGTAVVFSWTAPNSNYQSLTDRKSVV